MKKYLLKFRSRTAGWVVLKEFKTLSSALARMEELAPVYGSENLCVN